VDSLRRLDDLPPLAPAVSIPLPDAACPESASELPRIRDASFFRSLIAIYLSKQTQNRPTVISRKAIRVIAEPF
jgi:hypothetical protein